MRVINEQVGGDSLLARGQLGMKQQVRVSGPDVGSRTLNLWAWHSSSLTTPGTNASLLTRVISLPLKVPATRLATNTGLLQH